MAPTEPTVLTLKQNFLLAQTRLLSQPLQPSRAWRRANEAVGEVENDRRLPERAVDDALVRLNHTLQQYTKRAYAPQATRHVAEQIENLYLAFGDRHVVPQEGEVGEDEEAWRLAGADYADAAVIASLPETWESEREISAQPLEAKRYTELVGRLQGLSARRAEAEARVGRLRKMKALLEPFSAEEHPADTPCHDTGGGSAVPAASNGVQENLVTRDGEVEKELERMRMLLARVGDKVARLRGRERSGDEEDDLFGEGDAMIVEDVEVEERRKVEGLLDGMR